MALFDLAFTGSPAPRIGRTSLRDDCTGKAMELTGFGRLTNGDAPILYDQGFTIEMAIKPTTEGVRAVGGGTSRIVPGVQSHANANDQSVFQLGFDNWASGGASLFPTFTILSDNNTYQSLLDHAVILGEARGTTLMILGNTYHLLGTLDANGLCQLYVNGVLEATASPNINMVDFISAGNLDLGNSARTLRDVFDIGTRFLDGAYRGESDAGQAVIDNVRFYDNHFSAADAAAAAAEVAFTVDTVGVNATTYIEDEISAGNPGGGAFRLDIFWKPDGTKLWAGRQDLDVSEYDVDPPWGIQPGDWSLVITVGGFTNFRSVWWSPDGRYFGWGRRLSSVFRIHINDQIANPWSIAAFGPQTSKTISVPPSGGSMLDHIWSADGKTVWIHTAVGVTARFLEFTVPVAWDPASIVGNTPSAELDLVPDAGTATRTEAFSADGSKLYAMVSQDLSSWDLSTPFDITTQSNFQTGPSVNIVVGIPRGLNYRDDNGDIFVEGDQNALRAAWFRIPLAGVDASEYCESDFQNNPETIGGGLRMSQWWKDDGTRVWTTRDSSNRCDQHDVSPAWSIEGPGVWTNRIDNNVDFIDVRKVQISPDGTVLLFIGGPSNAFIKSAPLSTPFDLSTLGAFVSTFISGGRLDMYWSSDGFTVWTYASVSNDIEEHDVSVAFDASTFNTTPAKTFDLTPDTGGINTFTFSPDGNFIYAVLGSSQRVLVSWRLSTPFDIDTAGSFSTGPSIGTAAEMAIPRGIFIRPDNLDLHIEQDQNLQQMKVFEPR
jgi:hypothetical protein